MANTLLDLVNADITHIVQVALAELTEMTWQNSKETMLRRLRANYDKLSLEQIDMIRSALGHSHTEERPCDVCKIMAIKEIQLSQD
jgi:hypothetical protein